MKKRILFICTHNSARSQMAEAMLNHFYGDRYQGFSAGTEPRGVNPLSVKVMNELDIDISSHTSKSVNDFLDMEIDQVITVCDNANETCPFFPGGKERIHKSFPDPSTATGSEDEKLARFREVRDEIKKWIDVRFG